MGDVFKSIAQAVSLADPDYARHTLEPVKTGEHPVGELSENTRRIHAVTALQHEVLGQIRKRQAEISSDPALYNDPATVNAWIADSRSCRTRIAILESMMTLAIYDQFPEIIVRDYIYIREGFMVVWSEKPEEDEDDAVREAASDVLTGKVSGRPS